jgi:glycosyltransferase involved in cell wall biosynthesis
VGSRVLLVCGRLDPGRDGVGDYVVRLAASLREQGAEPRILHVGGPVRVPGARRIGRSWGPASLLRAARLARRADVVHVQFAPSMYGFRIAIGALPLLIGRTPLITTVHEYGSWRAERLIPVTAWRLLEALRLADRETGLLVPRSRAVVATNAPHADVVRRRFPRGPAVETVPIGANVAVAPGIDRLAARGTVRDELGLAADAVLVAFFGFVHPVKGVRYLADAVAALAAAGREVHALVIGGFDSLALPGDEAVAFEAELREQIAAARAADRVHLTGFRGPEEVSRLLAAADVGVLPFTHGVTAKSGSLLTLLAHRLPTVVTAGEEGEPELTDGDRVVVVDRVRDGGALADGLRRVLDDEALAGRLGERGAAWAATRDWSAIAARHLELYAGVR